MKKVSQSILFGMLSVFAASMVLQVCCHQDWAELFAHELPIEEAAPSHSHDHSKNNSPDDECGPHKYKDLVKSDKLVVNDNLSVSFYTMPFSSRFTDVFSGLQKIISFKLVFFNKAGPPIHLLNSVFLN